jgi:hypothetical protein
MIKVFQTRRGARGNCFAACVASLLELGLEEMPEYLDEKGEPLYPGWLALWNEFLRPLGLGLVWVRHCACMACAPPPGYAIMAAKAPKDDEPENTHAVVCLDGAVVHDPLDDVKTHEGPYEPDHWYVFTVLDPVGVPRMRSALKKIAARRPCVAVADVAFYRSRQDARQGLRS